MGIQKYEEKASFDENYIRNLRNQIDSRDWDLRRTLQGFLEATQAKDGLQQEVSDTERALHEDRLRGFREIEAMKRNHEFHVDEFPRTNLQDNPNTIKNLMNRVRELQCEINYMHVSKDLKDAEPVHGGQLSHVPSESASFLHQDERRDLLGRAKIMLANVWNTQCTAGNVFRNPLAYPSSSHERIPTQWDHPDAGRVSERTCTGQLVTEDGDEGKGAIPNPRSLRSASTGNSFDPVIRRNCTNYGVDQQRLQIPELHFDKFTTPQTFSCWKIRFKSEVCSCSNFFTEAMLWIKDVEMATSVADLESSRSIQGLHPCQDFELLDARIASSLNKIIQNSYFKKKWGQKCSCFVDRDKEFGLCISGGEAVKIVIDFTEVLNWAMRKCAHEDSVKTGQRHRKEEHNNCSCDHVLEKARVSTSHPLILSQPMPVDSQVSVDSQTLHPTQRAFF